ncbi:hypothetical protein AAG570_004679 [Ranatra chinensis]|uniref:S-adenosylmethionine sensor upstream of mTORC1 n=1 Tax=Ranatra chinensis TaxID=642074 RepID=A0ABD0Y1V9_9HEMI
MACPEHIELSDFIKSVHRGLRRRSREVGAVQAWEEHCSDGEKLQKYAISMKKLATTYWDRNNTRDDGGSTCRIGWVVSKCRHYFTLGGEAVEDCRETKMCLKFFNREMSNDGILSEGAEVGKISLLDVGSCYNPFGAFSSEFEVTAIDLAPASGEVMKCDFLRLNCGTKKVVESGVCLELPSSSFDVVVFSLLLEYIPCSRERFTACEKAFALTRPGGLLFILTPDSKHPTANSRAMRRWRITLAGIGFWRVAYEKSKHLHCMAFRKCKDPGVGKAWARLQGFDNGPHDLMTIPQDFTDIGDKEDQKVDTERVPDLEIAEYFCMMPDGDYFD